jgi:hypothetical protein
MTRTERSHSLRALLKDRSEARNGMDSSVPKGGAGGHNWGSLDQAREITALVDEDADFDEGEATRKRRLVDVPFLPPLGLTFARSLSHSFPPQTREACPCPPHEQPHR